MEFQGIYNNFEHFVDDWLANLHETNSEEFWNVFMRFADLKAIQAELTESYTAVVVNDSIAVFRNDAT